jgi:selenide,water dikinase
LTQVLRHLVPFHDPAVLVDASTSDDAAVYRIDADRALVATVDFFTPIVDDPYDFGRIAAANALSDIYAMGARPLFALNIVAFPRDLLDQGILSEIVRGGGEIARLAGVAVVGGHSIDDAEPKFGMCVIGEVSPERLIRNSTAQPGDRLVLTKPIGTGIIATAIKRGEADESVIQTAVASMTTLNRAAAEAMLYARAHAATDLTGYGLLGHLHEIARASRLEARVDAGAVPLLPGALDLTAAGFIPGGTRRNERDLGESVQWDERIDDPLRALLCDAQTSGGLLIAIPPERMDQLLIALEEAGTPAAAVIGELVPGRAGTIMVKP